MNEWGGNEMITFIFDWLFLVLKFHFYKFISVLKEGTTFPNSNQALLRAGVGTILWCPILSHPV